MFGFWQRVTDGLTMRELWRQFRREAGASYRLYSRDLEDQPSRGPRVGRYVRTAGALLMAMLLRLSPARRVFLLSALLIGFLANASHRSGWAAIASLMLLGLLGLELADWVTMKRDLEIAREIQQWLVPQSAPRIAGYDCAFTTRPANTVAGDYFDAFPRPSSNGHPTMLIAVADVAGKSMPAALLMATFQASLRTLTFEPLPLAAVVSRLNRYCIEHSLEGRRFTTAFLAELHPETGHLAYVNAGHNAPILRRANGEIVRLETGGLLLGVRDNVPYEAGELRIGPGDLLVIFTDGVIDARSQSGAQFSEPRLVELVRSMPALTAEVALSQLMASVERFAGNAPQEDDVTCVVLRRAAA